MATPAPSPALARPDVVILNESARIAGGADRVACETAIGLAGRGYRVRFLCADADVDPSLLAAGIEVHPLPLVSVYEIPGRGEQLRALTGNPDAPPLVTEALVGLEPERTVVHVHNAGLRLTWTSIEACQRWGAPTVFTTHDYGAACPTSNFFDYPAERVCPRRPLGAACLRYECTGHGHRARLPRILMATAARRARVYRRHAAAIHPSPTARRIMEPFLRDVPRHEIVRNPQELGSGAAIPSRSETFLFVGRLVPEKDPRLFLLAAREAGVAAKVVGDGPLRKEMEREHPEADFTGWLSPHEVEAAFAAARVHVFPSRWRETMGLGVLDAASRGVPSIASEIVGAADWIREHDAGIVIPAGDVAALAAAMVALKDDAQVDALGGRAHEALWADPPTLDRHLDRLETLYADVVAGGIVTRGA